MDGWFSWVRQMTYNVLWYGVVRDYEAISYQFTPTFFTSHKRSQTAETRMHYTMCCVLPFIATHYLSLNSIKYHNQDNKSEIEPKSI